LNPKYDESVSNFSFDFNLRSYNEVRGSATVVKRCGQYAESHGLYSLEAKVSSAIFQIGASSTVTMEDAVVSLDSDSTGDASASFSDLAWRGKVSGSAALNLPGVGDVSGNSDDDAQGGGLAGSLKLTVAMTYTVEGGEFKFEGLVADGVFDYSSDALEMSGDVALTVPCARDQTTSVGRCMLTL